MSTLKATLIASGMLLSGVAGALHAQAITPRRLVEVADVSNPVVSPDGSLVAFRVDRASVDRNTYDTTWYVQSMKAASQPLRIGEGGIPLRDSAGTPLPASATWSPDGRWIYFRAAVGDRIDVWRAAADGSHAEPVTGDPADVRGFVLDEDGRTLKYRVGATREEVMAAEEAEYDRGIRIDETAPIGQGLYRSGYTEGRLATQRLSRVWFDRVPLLADVPDRWKGHDLAARANRDLTPREQPPEEPAAGLAKNGEPPWQVAREPHGNRIALLRRTGDDDGLMQKPGVELSMLRSAKADAAVVCTAEPCRGKAITAVQWRPGSDEVLFTATDPYRGQAQSISRWNVVTGEVRLVVAAKGLVNGGRDLSSVCGVSAEALACVTAEANQPPRLELIDLETGDRRVMFDPNAALARDLEARVEARLLRWTDAGGQPFSGYYFPARRTTGLPPLFVTYYTCPGFLRGGFGDEWPLAPMAEQGISALCINRVPEFHLDAVKRYDQGLSALRSAVDLLASAGEIDRGKVGMGGLSFGSEVTLWSVVYSDLLKAASVSSPTLSPTYYLIGSVKGETFLSVLDKFWQIDAGPRPAGQWKVLSHALNLDRISAPVLMQMPEQEYLFSLDYAIPLIRENKAELYVFPNEPHQKFQPRHKLAVYERNLDWFRFWLQGAEDENPAKRAQYERWRLMRNGMTADSRKQEH